jgi:two-component system sensor histidine kinase AlgZ
VLTLADKSTIGAAADPWPPMSTSTDKAKLSDKFYLPDFSAPGTVLAIVLIAEIVAIVLSLARSVPWPEFFPDLAKTSLLMLWMALTTAAVLSVARPALSRCSVQKASVISLLLVVANVAVISEFVYWVGSLYGNTATDGTSSWFPPQRWGFLLRNLAIGSIVTSLALRYFYISHEWKRNVEREAESRIHALQARIRPHFLFNSMNTIAALIGPKPVAAEQAVEDLADLFRASLSEPGQPISLKQELELARIYQRMEQQRLGDRLAVEWIVDEIPMRAMIPGLTIQPLLENAIYHGIEPDPSGGVVRIAGRRRGDMISITVSNPRPPASNQSGREGNRMALNNIRQRLELAYGKRASLNVVEDSDSYEVCLSFPFAA